MKARLLIAVIALQAAWVVTTVAIQETRQSHGTVVLLDTVPVDPRDLLRGDYVILSYAISTLPAALFADGLAGDVAPGTTVFVRLAERNGFHVAEAASFTLLEPESQHPVLRGTVSGSWGVGSGMGRQARVEYGLERFYVREGTGRPRGKLTVEVSVPRSGNAVIRQVYIDGRPYADVMNEQAR